MELNTSADAGLLSSCRHTSNTETVNEQLAVCPISSLAVQFTVVVPIAKHEPEGGVQTTVAPQFAGVVGAGKFTTVQDADGQAL